jgi:hypothetical protein
LRKLSEARVTTNQDFIYIRQDIDEFKKLQADKTVSLNEQDELNRAEQNVSRQKARDAERTQRAAPSEKIYEITLEDVNKRGLPPLLWPTNTVASPGLTNGTAGNNARGSREPTRSFPGAVSATTNSLNVPTDPWLDETEHILEDYVWLMNTNEARPIIAGH